MIVYYIHPCLHSSLTKNKEVGVSIPIEAFILFILSYECHPLSHLLLLGAWLWVVRTQKFTCKKGNKRLTIWCCFIRLSAEERSGTYSLLDVTLQEELPLESIEALRVNDWFFPFGGCWWLLCWGCWGCGGWGPTKVEQCGLKVPWEAEEVMWWWW